MLNNTQEFIKYDFTLFYKMKQKLSITSKLEEVLVFSDGREIFILDNIPNATPKKIASRDDWVTALCSHDGKLYDGGAYEKVFETLSGREIASRDDWVRALCSHDGKLYDGGDYEKVFETLSGREIASRKGWVRALCSHQRDYFVNAGVLK